VERSQPAERTADRSTGNEPISTTRQPDPPGDAASGSRIASAARSLGLELEDDQVSALAGLARRVAEWGARINLSGHREPEAILDALVLDALALGSAFEALTGGRPPRLVDLGSGAGFPGLPLAIAHRDLEVELVEARERRHYFQRSVCRELAIRNAHPRWGRIERLEPRPARWVVAQAVGPLETVVALAAPWVEAGGWLVVPTGNRPPTVDLPAEWSTTGTRPYGVPGARAGHRFWYARRRECENP
jgi:16S rRNA (guanine527-N7)-methyltransferase